MSRQILAVPVAIQPSLTDVTKKYTLTVVGYVVCSCMSAHNPPPGTPTGKCKHTDAYEKRLMPRTLERAQMVEAINDAKARLRAFDGGDTATPLSWPVKETT